MHRSELMFFFWRQESHCGALNQEKSIPSQHFERGTLYLVVHPTNRKWVITPVITGLTPPIPFITRGITHQHDSWDEPPSSKRTVCEPENHYFHRYINELNGPFSIAVSLPEGSLWPSTNGKSPVFHGGPVRDNFLEVNAGFV